MARVAKLKPSTKAKRVKAAPSGRWRRWRYWLIRIAIVLLCGPAVLLAIYRFVPPPGTPLMLQRLVQGYELDKDWTPLSAIAPSLPRSAIASEDNLFCEHWGFDTKALRQQIDAALDGRRARGASTISMQVAKNLFLWEGRDPVRKLLEAWLTPQVELLLGKRRIMEIYLNIAEMGPGIYGAEAASRHWFDRSAAKVGPDQASRLIAILPAPLHWSPVRSNSVARRAATIRHRVEQLGPMLACVA